MQRCLPSPTPEQSADLRLAAAKMTGATRRAFQAEMTVQYCDGNARQAERVCGWGRHTVALGLAERRPGILGLGAQSPCSGRKRGEDEPPQVAQALWQLAEPPAHQDPTVRTTLASTRRTATGALEALRAQGDAAAQRPAPSTMAAVLHRLGLRLRQGLKATPHKTLKATDAIVDNLKKKTRTRRPQATSNG